MRTALLATAAALFLAGGPALAQTQTPLAPSDQPATQQGEQRPLTAGEAIGAQDREFVGDAALGNLFEIRTSEIALQRSKDAQVEAFAQQMITDHQQAHEQLQTMAQELNIDVPTEMDSARQAVIEELQGLSGTEFDRAYVEAQIAAHELTIANFTEQAVAGQQPSLKGMAEQKLPVLREHLEMAQQLQDRVGRQAMR